MPTYPFPVYDRSLLELGADYTYMNEDGETAESAARINGKTEAADVLAAWAKDPKAEVKKCQHEVNILKLLTGMRSKKEALIQFRMRPSFPDAVTSIALAYIRTLPLCVNIYLISPR